MPQVTTPADGAETLKSTFIWTMDSTSYISSMVIIGSAPGSDDVYAGTEIQKENGTTDHNVTQPEDDGMYYTRVKFRVTPGGTWYTTNSTITHFISLDPNSQSLRRPQETPMLRDRRPQTAKSLRQLILEKNYAMNLKSFIINDRPYVALSLSDEGLTVRWGPQQGPWGISSGKPCTCTVTRWELHVGTKEKPSQQDGPNEQIGNEIIPKKMSKTMSKNQNPQTIFYLTETEILIPRDKLVKKIRPHEQILARVIGYFYLKDNKGRAIEYGIYSDVARLVMDNGKPRSHTFPWTTARLK